MGMPGKTIEAEAVVAISSTLDCETQQASWRTMLLDDVRGGLTTEAQRPGPRDATIATTTLTPGSLQRMVRHHVWCIGSVIHARECSTQPQPSHLSSRRTREYEEQSAHSWRVAAKPENYPGLRPSKMNNARSRGFRPRKRQNETRRRSRGKPTPLRATECQSSETCV